eukprot:m.123278 g.123278  ORF g.123278 m.123278 type:complete len:479 (-) comp15675_c1_seq11:166-1602(-)
MASCRAREELVADDIFREISEQGLQPVLSSYDFFIKRRNQGNSSNYHLEPLLVKNVSQFDRQLEVRFKDGKTERVAIRHVIARLQKLEEDKPKEKRVWNRAWDYLTGGEKPVLYAEGAAKPKKQGDVVMHARDDPPKGLHAHKGHGVGRLGSGKGGWKEPSRVYAQQPAHKHEAKHEVRQYPQEMRYEDKHRHQKQHQREYAEEMRYEGRHRKEKQHQEHRRPLSQARLVLSTKPIEVQSPSDYLGDEEVTTLKEEMGFKISPFSLTPDLWMVAIAACLPPQHPLRQLAVKPVLLQRFAWATAEQKSNILFEVLNAMAAGSVSHPLAESLYWRYVPAILSSFKGVKHSLESLAVVIGYLLSFEGHTGHYTAQLILRQANTVIDTQQGLALFFSVLYACSRSSRIKTHLDGCLGEKFEQRYVHLLQTTQIVMDANVPFATCDTAAAAFLQTLAQETSHRAVFQHCRPPKAWPLSNALLT